MHFNDQKSELVVHSQSRTRVVFTIKNVDYRFLNTFRHILLEEIPCLAFHTFRFAINDTVLRHEEIMHRLRMIPLRSENAADMAWTKDCSCRHMREPCECCSARFELDVENTHETQILEVTTEHIKQTKGKLPVEFLYQHQDAMTIVALAPGQKIKLTAFAQKGIGRENGKWVMVPTVVFQGVPQFELEAFQKLPKEQQSEIVASCPKKVFVLKDEIEIENALACTVCDECMITANKFQAKNNKRKIGTNLELSDTDFIVKVQTDKRMDIQAVLKIAFSILKEKLQHLL